MSETTREFVAIDFPTWLVWGQRRGASIDNAAIAQVYPDHRHYVRVEDEALGYRFDYVGTIRRCGWCAQPCSGRRTAWCSNACRDRFYRVWSWEAVARYVRERDETCRRCGTADPGEPHGARYAAWEVDHIIPVRHGGTDDPANLRLLCHACHVAVGYEQRAQAGEGE